VRHDELALFRRDIRGRRLGQNSRQILLAEHWNADNRALVRIAYFIHTVKSEGRLAVNAGNFPLFHKCKINNDPALLLINNLWWKRIVEELTGFPLFVYH
jgi:hypothetical protein